MNWLFYDGHGNIVRTMNTSFALSGFQWRGVWGERTNSTPTRGYCANLGHPEDETGLVYMRARYYEPTTGRFISEDPARDGVNWFLYADGDPVNRVDRDGKDSDPATWNQEQWNKFWELKKTWAFFFMGIGTTTALGGVWLAMQGLFDKTPQGMGKVLAGAVMIVTGITLIIVGASLYRAYVLAIGIANAEEAGDMLPVLNAYLQSLALLRG